jgi:hypothetical protein
MSPELDPNHSTASAEAVEHDSSAENSSASADSRIAASAGSATAGAATAVARASEARTETPEVSASVASADGSARQHSATIEEAPVVAAAAPVVCPVSHDAPTQALAPVTADETPVASTAEAAPTETGSIEIATVDIPGSATPDATAEAGESNETMDQLMKQFDAPEPVVPEGEIFDGHVIAVTDAGVIVDVGGKFEGLVPAQEFLESGSPIEFGKGQTIEVERLHAQKDGYVLLSHTRAHRRRVWERIERPTKSTPP